MPGSSENARMVLWSKTINNFEREREVWWLNRKRVSLSWTPRLLDTEILFIKKRLLSLSLSLCNPWCSCAISVFQMYSWHYIYITFSLLKHLRQFYCRLDPDWYMCLNNGSNSIFISVLIFILPKDQVLLCRIWSTEWITAATENLACERDVFKNAFIYFISSMLSSCIHLIRFLLSNCYS